MPNPPQVDPSRPVPKPYSAACERNQDAILEVLREHFSSEHFSSKHFLDRIGSNEEGFGQKAFDPTGSDTNSAGRPSSKRNVVVPTAHVLEVGSGTGQHAVHFAAALPQLVWQTSDVPANLSAIRQWLVEADLPNTPAPLAFDIRGVAPQATFDAIFSANTLHIMSWQEVERLFRALPALLREPARMMIYGPFKYGGQFTSASNAAFDAMLRAGEPHRGIRDFEAVDALARAVGLVLLEDCAMPAHNRCITWVRPESRHTAGQAVAAPPRPL